MKEIVYTDNNGAIQRERFTNRREKKQIVARLHRQGIYKHTEEPVKNGNGNGHAHRGNGTKRISRHRIAARAR